MCSGANVSALDLICDVHILSGGSSSPGIYCAYQQTPSFSSCLPQLKDKSLWASEPTSACKVVQREQCRPIGSLINTQARTSPEAQSCTTTPRCPERGRPRDRSGRGEETTLG